jgi:hypothetical protein
MANLSAYPTNTPKNSDLLVGTKTATPGTNEKPITSNFLVSDVSKLVNKGYKDYVFSFTQSSTNNPVVTELNNDTGLTFTFTRDNVGNFHLVPSSSLDVSKTWAQVTGGNIGNAVLNIKNYQANLISIANIQTTTGTPVDEVNVGFVELRIYN